MNIIQEFFLRLKHNKLVKDAITGNEYRVVVIHNSGNAYCTHRGKDLLEAISNYREQKQKQPTNLVEFIYDCRGNERSIEQRIMSQEEIDSLEILAKTVDVDDG